MKIQIEKFKSIAVLVFAVGISTVCGSASADEGVYVAQGGLTWMPVTFSDTWTNADTYCTTTTINGQTGWRQPTHPELKALYESGAMLGKGWELNYTWTSTPGANQTHAFVYLKNGGARMAYDTDRNKVSCVHSGVMPNAVVSNPILIPKNGTEVSIQKTGLTWRRCVEGMEYRGGTCIGKPKLFTYKGALKHAETETLRTGIKWRVPTQPELVGIVDENNFNPSIDSKLFPKTPYFMCNWSSSLHEMYTYKAWYVCFAKGQTNSIEFGDTNFLRLVR